jgi:hypothetical protein
MPNICDNLSILFAVPSMEATSTKEALIFDAISADAAPMGIYM